MPGHGSAHLFPMHALLYGQSEFRVHSGLHPSYGLPIKSGKQVQEPALLSSLHWALAPQGEGEHGVMTSDRGGAKNEGTL